MGNSYETENNHFKVDLLLKRHAAKFAFNEYERAVADLIEKVEKYHEAELTVLNHKDEINEIREALSMLRHFE